MFILSQDKKNLAEYRKIYIQKNWGGKKGNKSVLIGDVLHAFSSSIVLGMYADQEEAVAELGRICEAMKNGDTVYAVK